MDYKQVISDILEAVQQIKDEKVREYTYNRLLENSLSKAKNVSQTEEANEGANPAKTVRAKRKSASDPPPFRINSVRDEIKVAFEDVNPIQEGLKPLKDLKEKWQMYLWVLEIGRQKGIDMMTNSEIAYVLSERFTRSVTEKQVNNLTFKTMAGYVQKRELENSTRAWKIMVPGIEILRIEDKTSGQAS